MDQISATGAVLPFEPRLSAAQAFEHASWRQARQTVLEALAAGRLALVVGEAGAGKTLLLQALERALRAGGLKVRFVGPDGAAGPGDLDAVWLADDADTLDDAALRRLAREGGATVLAIRPRSLGRVKALPARVAAPAWLSPLTHAEVEAFVADALTMAGSPPDLFTTEAVAALAALSGGLPGSLNRLARASLLRARSEGAPRVEAGHVRLAAGAVPPGPAGQGLPRFRWRRLGLLALASVLLAMAMAWWVLTGPAPPGLVEAPRPAILPGDVPGRVAAPGAPLAPAPHTVPPEASIAAGTARPDPSPPPGPRPDVDGATAAEPRPGAVPRPQARPSPPQAEAAEPGTFRGSTFNETLGRGGRLRISVSRPGPGEAVAVGFEASGGLIGEGRLTGRLSRDGHLVATGTLVMGRNPFATELEGRIAGDLLVGTARYTRVADPGARPSVTRGSFRLTRE